MTTSSNPPVLDKQNETILTFGAAVTDFTNPGNAAPEGAGFLRPCVSARCVRETSGPQEATNPGTPQFCPSFIPPRTCNFRLVCASNRLAGNSNWPATRPNHLTSYSNRSPHASSLLASPSIRLPPLEPPSHLVSLSPAHFRKLLLPLAIIQTPPIHALVRLHPVSRHRSPSAPW